MIRLHITAEGQTEQVFAKTVLTPHLAPFNVFVDARCVLTSKDKRAAKGIPWRFVELRQGEEGYSELAEGGQSPRVSIHHDVRPICFAR